MKKLLYISVVFVTILAFSSCTSMPSIEELIDQEVDVRLEKLRSKKRVACKEYVLTEAELMVDSIMYLEIGSTLKDALPVPEKPLRPGDSLAYSVELDTVGVREILNDSLMIDTLNGIGEQ